MLPGDLDDQASLGTPAPPCVWSRVKNGAGLQLTKHSSLGSVTGLTLIHGARSQTRPRKSAIVERPLISGGLPRKSLASSFNTAGRPPSEQILSEAAHMSPRWQGDAGDCLHLKKQEMSEKRSGAQEKKQPPGVHSPPFLHSTLTNL